MSETAGNSFNDIYTSYYKKSFFFAKSYVHDDLVAEDIASDSLIKLWEKLKSDSIEEKYFRQWVNTIKVIHFYIKSCIKVKQDLFSCRYRQILRIFAKNSIKNLPIDGKERILISEGICG